MLHLTPQPRKLRVLYLNCHGGDVILLKNVYFVNTIWVIKLTLPTKRDSSDFSEVLYEVLIHS